MASFPPKSFFFFYNSAFVQRTPLSRTYVPFKLSAVLPFSSQNPFSREHGIPLEVSTSLLSLSVVSFTSFVFFVSAFYFLFVCTPRFNRFLNLALLVPSSCFIDVRFSVCSRKCLSLCISHPPALAPLCY